MKLTGSLCSLAVCLSVAWSQARAQETMPVPRGLAPMMPPMMPGLPGMPRPGMAMAVPPGGTAFPPAVVTLAPDGSAAPGTPSPEGAGYLPPPGAAFGLPAFGMPTCCPEPGYNDCHEAMPHPAMIGGYLGLSGTQQMFIRTLLRNENGPPFARVFNDPYLARVPILSRGAFKIAEGESPQPMTRFYWNMSYFTDVRAKFALQPGSFRTDVPSAGDPPVDFQDSLANVNFQEIRVRRDTIGAEIAFKENLISIGIRASFIDAQQDISQLVDQADAEAANEADPTTTFSALPVLGGVDKWQASDITVIVKAALCKDYATGDIVSVGLAATIPTGHSFTSAFDSSRELHPGLLQPFVGWLCNFGACYLHGFTSAVIPTEERDVYFIFNDIGFGWWLYKNECADGIFINGIVPTVEVHVATPLRNGDSKDDPIGAPHTTSLTVGCHVFTFGWASITTGISTVLSGPRPYDLEATSQLNIRF